MGQVDERNIIGSERAQRALRGPGIAEDQARVGAAGKLDQSRVHSHRESLVAIRCLGGFSRTVTYRQTARLILRAVDTAEAQRIRDRTPSAEDRWAEGYPFEGDLAAIGAFLRATDDHGDQRPFGYYQITRRTGGAAVGGIGFLGPPEDGMVEIGFGLIPAARGHGYAAEALFALMAIADEHDVRRFRADTSLDNIASQRTLEHAGFEQVGTDDELLHYQAGMVPQPG